MKLVNEFDTVLRANLASKIPCVHIPKVFLAEKVLLSFREYVNDAKNRGIVNLDDLLEDMKIKDGQPRD